MLAELLEALAMQTAEGGMLLQLPARHDLGENYPETSGTLLFCLFRAEISKTPG